MNRLKKAKESKTPKAPKKEQDTPVEEEKKDGFAKADIVPKMTEARVVERAPKKSIKSKTPAKKQARSEVDELIEKKSQSDLTTLGARGSFRKGKTPVRR